MGVLIEIPSALKQYVNNQDQVEVVGSSVEEALDSLCAQFTELKPNLFTKMVLSEILSTSISMMVTFVMLKG